MNKIEKHLARRDALFRNPTLEAATSWLRGKNTEQWLSPDTPLAMLHKARLQWLDATDAMLLESLQWLAEHDYKPSLAGAPPLTPESRDAQRAWLCMPPMDKGGK